VPSTLLWALDPGRGLRLRQLLLFCFLADSLASQQRQPRCHASYALPITTLPPPLDIGRIGGVNRPTLEAGPKSEFSTSTARRRCFVGRRH
jgi:hypothetical protein